MGQQPKIKTPSPKGKMTNNAVAAAQLWSANIIECQYSYFLKPHLQHMNHFRAYIPSPEQDGKPWNI